MKIPSLINQFCDAVWEYDPETNEVYLHYDDMNPELCRRWIPFGIIDQIYRETYISPMDIEIWERFLTPEKMKNFVDGNMEEDHFYIRLEHTQKGSEWHEVYLERTEENHLLLASRDVKDMKRNEIIAQAVIPEFDYVCRIDVAEQSYILYYSDSNNSLVPQSASDNYHKILEEFNRTYVVPEEAEELTKKMRLENVIKELENKDEYILYATAKDYDGLTYKKLRFSYESPAKDRILLTRTDVSELIGERKLRKEEREKRLRYLQNMPVAFCSTKILLNDKGEPYDFQFTYCNKAHEKLEGVKEGELLGKNFYEFFKETDPKWLTYYYETAYKGINHVIRSYSPEIQKHLLIYTFQSEPGYCECALLDVSEEYFLNQELERNRENLKRILGSTTDLVFEYRLEQEEIILDNYSKEEPQILLKAPLCQNLAEKEILDPNYQKILEDGFSRIKTGEHSVSVVIRSKLSSNEKWSWYRVTMFDFQDGHTHERKVFGFFQNIDQDKNKEEELLQKAQMDSLTNVFNAGAGKLEIRTRLEKKREDDGSYYAMFVIDMDNFKKINDTKGHLIGDQVLVEFAQILRNTFRAQDIIYRLGGDEFVVFMERIHDPDSNLNSILQRFHLHMEKARAVYPFLSCSIGIFVAKQFHTFEICYKFADQALYETKNNHKGYYTVKKDEGVE